MLRNHCPASVIPHCNLALEIGFDTCKGDRKAEGIPHTGICNHVPNDFKAIVLGFYRKADALFDVRDRRTRKGIAGLDLPCFTGGTPSLDEIEFKPLDKRRLVKYASKYPSTVRNTLTHSLAFEHFAE